jgi:hypothetical protein
MTNQDLMGKLGEQIVASIFEAIISEDPYDMDKDMLLIESQEDAEVKMQNRHRAYNVFSVPLPRGNKYKNQVKKCVSVSRLFFVEYEIDGSDRIRVWECIDRNYIPYTTSFGQMAGFDINKMLLIKDYIDPVAAAKARAYSQAKK